MKRSKIRSDLNKTLILFILCLLFGLCRSLPSNDIQPEDVSSNELAQITENPKLLVFMIDGFRWDYYDKHKENMDAFEQFLAEGVQAEWVEPVFPSMSYPGWTTLSTGVYPETHGIIGNHMYNKNTDAIFDLDDDTSTGNLNWWQTSEPIWTLATRERLKVFLRLWSRCDIPFHDILPNGECTPYRSVKGIDAIEETLRIAAYQLHEQDLVMVYGEHIDNVGHEFGPDSAEMVEALRGLNRVFKRFWDILLDTSLEDKVNIIIISDHGMTAVRNFTFVELGDYLKAKDVNIVLESGALVCIDPYAQRLDEIYHRLKTEMPGVDVYKREEIPEKFRYKHNILVHEILVVARPGYYIRGLRTNPNREYHPRDGYHSKQIPLQPMDSKQPGGAHGYSDMEDMRTIFFAKGPAFKKGVKVPPIQMVDIYQIFTNALNIPPQPNNGTWSNVEGMFLNKTTPFSISVILLANCLVLIALANM